MWCATHCGCHIIPDGAGAEICAKRGPGTNRGAGILGDVGGGVTVRGGGDVRGGVTARGGEVFDSGTLGGAVVMVGAGIAASTLETGTATGVVVAFGMVGTFRGGRNNDS
eukprot:9476266-Ditylum_brightwellii.AAC.1